MTETALILIDPADARVSPLIEAHFRHSTAHCPTTSNHTMSVSEMAEDGVLLFALLDGRTAIACGGLKDLGDGLFEVKSVHVAERARGQGLSRLVMAHLEAEARTQGARELVLETGSERLPAYDAARALYEQLGYAYCGPIPGYDVDPDSAFMRLPLEQAVETPQ